MIGLAFSSMALVGNQETALARMTDDAVYRESNEYRLNRKTVLMSSTPARKCGHRPRRRYVMSRDFKPWNKGSNAPRESMVGPELFGPFKHPKYTHVLVRAI